MGLPLSEIRQKCLLLQTKGLSPKEIYISFYSKHSISSLESFKRTLRKWRSKDQTNSQTQSNKTDEEIIDILKKGVSIERFYSDIASSPQEAINTIARLRSEGYNILEVGDELKLSTIIIPADNHIDKFWDGRRRIRFGLISDTHLNSKYAQITHLHTFYDICASRGIHKVYHAGDIDEGEQMRVGHQYECYKQGADAHVNHIIDVYPQRRGIETEFITGNHDDSIVKRCGYDIGHPISNRRDDMKYLGQSNAIISLTPNCKFEIRHPLDGAASYALSYKLQKMIDSISGGEKPNILAVGHYHKTEYILYRNIHAFQTGCFQAQTNFMKGKGLSASIGGWIIEIMVEEDGTITEINPVFIPFYKAITDDYLNWI